MCILISELSLFLIYFVCIKIISRHQPFSFISACLYLIAAFLGLVVKLCAHWSSAIPQ